MADSNYTPQSAEQDVRDLLERMGVDDAQSFASGDLVELANILVDLRKLKRHFFLIKGIVKTAEEVLSKQKPDSLKVDKGLPFEEWKLYIAIEEYKKIMQTGEEP